MALPSRGGDLSLVVANAAITGATKCKITYDSKGLVTAGADLAASDIPELAISKISGLQDALNSKVPRSSHGDNGMFATYINVIGNDSSEKWYLIAYSNVEISANNSTDFLYLKVCVGPWEGNRIIELTANCRSWVWEFRCFGNAQDRVAINIRKYNNKMYVYFRTKSEWSKINIIEYTSHQWTYVADYYKSSPLGTDIANAY